MSVRRWQWKSKAEIAGAMIPRLVSILEHHVCPRGH